MIASGNKKRIGFLLAAMLGSASVLLVSSCNRPFSPSVTFDESKIGTTQVYKVNSAIKKSCQESRFPVRVEGRWGYIDRRGHIVITPQFDYAFPFSDGLAPVTKNATVAYINEFGKVVIPFGAISSAESFSEGRAVFTVAIDNGLRSGFIDRTGRVRVSPRYYHAAPFKEGLARVERDHFSRFGFIDRSGGVRIPFIYIAAGDFSDGLAAVFTKTGWGFINRNGKSVIPSRYANVRRFSEGLAGVKVGNMWGFIDKRANTVIRPRFEDVDIFSEALAPVKIGEQWGFINRSGKFIVDPNYFAVQPFSNGRAMVSRIGFSDIIFNPRANANVGFVDARGSLILPYAFDRAQSFQCGLASVTIETSAGAHLEGYIDTSGRYLWQPSN